ncbi:MAG: hypothetical protein VZT48_03785 [Bulleidia sp.]|nr:hypothetical protein [Bulleidia sp.]
MTLQIIFLVLIGVLAVTSGFNSIQNASRITKPKDIYDGKVQSSTLRSTKDPEGRLIQHYYSLQVLFLMDGKKKTTGVKSTAEYLPGDPIRIVLNDHELVPFERQLGSALSGYLQIAAGVLTALSGILYYKVSETAGGMALGFIFLLFGLSVLSGYISERDAGFIPFEASVSGNLLTDTSSRNSRILKPKNVWYPMYTYTKDGKDRTFISRINTTKENGLKEGTKDTFYFDEKNHCIVEKAAPKSNLVLSVILMGIGAFGILSTLIG